GGTDGYLLDRGEQLLDGFAQSLLDRGADRRKGDGRQRILEAEQIGRGLFADQVGAGRQGLAQLDSGGPQRLERVGIGRLCRDTRTDTGDTDQTAYRRRSKRVALDAPQRAVTSERSAP